MKFFATGASALLMMLAAATACSSSNNDKPPPPSILSCMGAQATGPGSPACSACLNTNCNSEVSSLNASCSAFNACYAGCSCTDTSCFTNCLATKADGECGTAYLNVGQCLAQHCTSECNIAAQLDGG
jgi:hypothetical protein